MPHDPLEILLRVRRQAVDEGHRNLVAALDAASVSEDAARRAEHSILLETERVSRACGDDSMVEAFAAWLPSARHRLTQALALQDRQGAEVARCRAELTACRKALESLEQLRNVRHAAKQDALDRMEARQLDETASCLKPLPV